MSYVLTDTDNAALRAYAIEHGPRWKAALFEDWYHARLSGTLHTLRNTHGPAWLRGFTFAQPIEFPNLSRTPKGELQRMITALCLHSWNNTEEENIRLWAARRERRRRASK